MCPKPMVFCCYMKQEICSHIFCWHVSIDLESVIAVQNMLTINNNHTHSNTLTWIHMHAHKLIPSHSFQISHLVRTKRYMLIFYTVHLKPEPSRDSCMWTYGHISSEWRDMSGEYEFTARSAAATPEKTPWGSSRGSCSEFTKNSGNNLEPSPDAATGNFPKLHIWIPLLPNALSAYEVINSTSQRTSSKRVQQGKGAIAPNL